MANGSAIPAGAFRTVVPGTQALVDDSAREAPRGQYYSAPPPPLTSSGLFATQEAPSQRHWQGSLPGYCGDPCDDGIYPAPPRPQPPYCPPQRQDHCEPPRHRPHPPECPPQPCPPPQPRPPEDCDDGRRRRVTTTTVTVAEVGCPFSLRSLLCCFGGRGRDTDSVCSDDDRIDHDYNHRRGRRDEPYGRRAPQRDGWVGNETTSRGVQQPVMAYPAPVRPVEAPPAGYPSAYPVGYPPEGYPSVQTQSRGLAAADMTRAMPAAAPDAQGGGQGFRVMVPQSAITARVHTDNAQLVPVGSAVPRADPGVPAPADPGAGDVVITPTANSSQSFANARTQALQALQTLLSAFDVFKSCRELPIPTDPGTLVATLDRGENFLNAIWAKISGIGMYFPRIFGHLIAAAVYGIMGLGQLIQEKTAGLFANLPATVAQPVSVIPRATRTAAQPTLVSVGVIPAATSAAPLTQMPGQLPLGTVVGSRGGANLGAQQRREDEARDDIRAAEQSRVVLAAPGGNGSTWVSSGDAAYVSSSV